jgi:ATP-dependent Zn protease
MKWVIHLVGKLLPKCDPVHKVTIVSRGMALGLTMTLPEDHVLLQNKKLWIEWL